MGNDQEQCCEIEIDLARVLAEIQNMGSEQDAALTNRTEEI